MDTGNSVAFSSSLVIKLSRLIKLYIRLIAHSGYSTFMQDKQKLESIYGEISYQIKDGKYLFIKLHYKYITSFMA